MDGMNGMNAAAGDSVSAAIAALGSPLEGPSLVQVVAALAVVIGAIAVVAWIYRRMTGVRTGSARGADIRVVSRAQVDRKSLILLVEVDGRRILVGATPQSLSPLSEWEETPEPEMPVEEARVAIPARFDSVLGRVITKLRAIEEVPS